MAASERTVFELISTTDRTLVSVDESKFADDNAHVPGVISDSLPKPNWGMQNAVRTYGRKIFDLLSSHPSVKAILHALSIEQAHHPIYFRLRDAASEQHYWETICSHDDSFLGLSSNRPIGRIPKSDSQIQSPKQYAGELRILGILSALNRPAEGQYEALLATAGNSNVEVKLHLCAGENDLLKRIQTENKPQVVDIRAIPGDLAEFVELLEEARPHIIHFFCHGIAASGMRKLLIAKNTDHLAGEDIDSLKLTPENFVDISRGTTALDETWMVVMNCCDAGQATSKNSFVHELVSSGVVPTSIGMLEAVPESLAKSFAQILYPRIFAALDKKRMEINQHHGTDDETAKIGNLEWVDVLQLFRQTISQSNGQQPSENPSWALPVIYVRTPEFQIQLVDAKKPSEAMKSRIETVSNFLASLAEDADKTMRLQILNLLNDDPPVPKRFWPDEFGNFGK